MGSESVSSGDRVCFTLAEVLSPGPQEALDRLTGQAQLVGKVVFICSAGERKEQFAIIEAEGVLTPLIVPIPQLSKIVGYHPAQAAG
jgi:hypothetical protein